MEKLIQIKRGAKSAYEGLVYGAVIGNGDSGGMITVSYDDEQCLDAVAGKLGTERLAICNRIIEGVLRGEKMVVEIIADDDDDPGTGISDDVVEALVNTLYSRCTDNVPAVMSSATFACFGYLCESNAEEHEWLADIDRLLAYDLVILQTPERYTEMIKFAESSWYSRSNVSGYRKFSRLLHSRLESEGQGRTFITLKFPRWRFPGMRWLERRRCMASNRAWHADLEFCEGTKETCSSY